MPPAAALRPTRRRLSAAATSLLRASRCRRPPPAPQQQRRTLGTTSHLQAPTLNGITCELDDALATAHPTTFWDAESLAVSHTAAWLRSGLSYPGASSRALGVLLASDEAIRALNSEYRTIDAPTDVLSFGLDPSDGPPDQSLDEIDLGDLVLGAEYLQRWVEDPENFPLGQPGRGIGWEQRVPVVV